MANKQVDNSKYIEIEKVVNSYKASEDGAAEKLIELFQPILRKYKNVICYGKTELSSQTVRSFVKLFARRDINISLYRRSAVARKVAEDAISLISSMFCMYEPEEIDNILITVLLGLAQKYKTYDGRAQFHMYVSSCFHYRLYEQLMILVDDPVNLCNLQDAQFHDNYKESATYDDYDLEVPAPNIAKLVNKSITSDEVGEGWLLGVNCDVFAYFTPAERKLLKLKFVDGLSDDEIAEEMCVCRHTIMRKRQKLIKDLSVYATSKGLLRG